LMLIGRLRLNIELVKEVLSLLFREVLSRLFREFLSLLYSLSCLVSFLNLHFRLYIRVFFLKAGL
jgi:hypothetical protein